MRNTEVIVSPQGLSSREALSPSSSRHPPRKYGGKSGPKAVSLELFTQTLLLSNQDGTRRGTHSEDVETWRSGRSHTQKAESG